MRPGLRDRFQLAKAKAAFNRDEFRVGKRLLQPLIKREIAEAILLDACVHTIASARRAETAYQNGIRKAAALGSAEALYLLAVEYDLNTSAFFNAKASRLFRNAANRGHVRSQWIYATELLWGLGHFPQNISCGLRYLHRAKSAGLPEAYETLARLHETGEFGHPVDPLLAAHYRAIAECEK